MRQIFSFFVQTSVIMMSFQLCVDGTAGMSKMSADALHTHTQTHTHRIDRHTHIHTSLPLPSTSPASVSSTLTTCTPPRTQSSLARTVVVILWKGRAECHHTTSFTRPSHADQPGGLAAVHPQHEHVGGASASLPWNGRAFSASVYNTLRVCVVYDRTASAPFGILAPVVMYATTPLFTNMPAHATTHTRGLQHFVVTKLVGHKRMHADDHMCT